MGRPVLSAENWAQGVGVVTFEPGNGRYAYEAVAIHDGEAVFMGSMFVSGLGAESSEEAA